MRSIVMTSAHKIFKNGNVTFSESLTLAWKAFKNDVRIIVTESWNKIKRVAFTKNGTTSGTIENVISAFKSVVNNSGASLYYDGKTFNND